MAKKCQLILLIKIQNPMFYKIILLPKFVDIINSTSWMTRCNLKTTIYANVRTERVA